MIRALELVLLLLPLLAFAAWRVAVARGLSGPPPRQLALAFAVVGVLAAFLYVTALREAPRPGPYVPAHLENGRVVPGHAG